MLKCGGGGRIEITANVRVQPFPRASINVMTVRILVVDDHPVVRHGLRTLLGSRPEWKIVGEAADGIEAVDKAHSLKPDVILLDVSMPKMDGLEACRRIRKIVPESEVLMVTQHDSPQMMREAISAGAKGYVVKANVARDLPAAVEAVSQHRPFTSLNHEAGGSD